MIKLDYHKADFLISCAKLSQLPPDEGVEVAFVGRSNAGKSSVLNQLTQNKKLARVSKTPGRTRLINIFTLSTTQRLVDLPGYGYAKVSNDIKVQWQKTLGDYLRSRDCLRGLVLVMDIRHPLTEFDTNLLNWADECGLDVHILLNKADKLSKNVIKNTLFKVEKALRPVSHTVTLQAFSAMKGEGVEDLREHLDTWFNL